MRCRRCGGSGRESQDDGLMLTEGDCFACMGLGVELPDTSTYEGPREHDCRYGCCKAGDQLIYTEVVPR